MLKSEDCAVCAVPDHFLVSRIGRPDDFVDSRLIETFIAVIALEDFQVRPQRARGAKLLGLGRRDRAGLNRPRRTPAIDLPKLRRR